MKARIKEKTTSGWDRRSSGKKLMDDALRAIPMENS